MGLLGQSWSWAGPDKAVDTINEWGGKIEDGVNHIGGVAEDLMGGGGESADPYGQKPYLQDIYKNAQGLYNSGAGNTPSWITDQWKQFAGPNNPFAATAGGAYLNSNPYLDKTFDKASDAVTRAYTGSVVPGIQSSFGRAGGYNRASEAGALDNANRGLGSTLNNLATDIYGGNYARERGYQEGAIGNQVGLQGQALGQSAQIGQDPWRLLQNYQGAIGAPPGAGPPQQGGNPLMGALGGAAAGSQFGPWGALGGGLLGFFGSK